MRTDVGVSFGAQKGLLLAVVVGGPIFADVGAEQGALAAEARGSPPAWARRGGFRGRDRNRLGHLPAAGVLQRW